MANRTAYIDRIHASYNRGFANNQVTFIQGWARFKDSHTLTVVANDGSQTEYTAARILIAVGGKPSIPQVPGAEYGITSDGFFELNSLPKTLTVVGAGYIAVEIAGVMASFGVEVNLVTRGPRPLRFLDADMGDELLKHLHHQKVNHLANSEVLKVTKDETNNQLQITLCESSVSKATHADAEVVVDCSRVIESEVLIWAIGREPNLQGLGLENTQVTLDDKGYIAVDKYQQTQDPAVLAVGDVTHMPQLTPVAIKAGRLLAERLYGNQPEAHYEVKYVPTVIFSHPPIGSCGLTEYEAVKKYGLFSAENPDGVKVYKSRFTSMISALAPEEDREMTFMKLVVRGTHEEVIGLHGIGHGVDEMIQGFAVAMEMGATKADFDRTVAIHPTGSEEFVTMR